MMQTLREITEILTTTIRKVTRLERQLDALQIPEVYMPVSTADVSVPPTDAELDAAFGTPATVGAGFHALVDDNGADNSVWFVTTNGASWRYLSLNKAV